MADRHELHKALHVLHVSFGHVMYPILNQAGEAEKGTIRQEQTFHRK